MRVGARDAFVKTIRLVGSAGTDGGVDSVGRAAKHGKVQRDSTIAARNRLQVHCIKACRIICVARESIGVSLDDGLCNCVVVGRKHLQHERHEAIRTQNTLQLLRVGARGAFIKTIRLVGGAGTDGGVDSVTGIVKHNKLQGDNAIATSLSFQF